MGSGRTEDLFTSMARHFLSKFRKTARVALYCRNPGLEALDSAERAGSSFDQKFQSRFIRSRLWAVQSCFTVIVLLARPYSRPCNFDGMTSLQRFNRRLAEI
jgi:hypothetical protein